jgi:hypothetical protein
LVPFNYFLYHHRRSIDATEPEWQMPIPVKRPGSTQPGNLRISYGEYFTAVHAFLSTDDGRSLIRVLSQHLGHSVTMADIDQIDIVIQKHGAFYHPARVDVIIDGEPIPFVVNLAVSPQGQAVLGHEYNLLSQIGQSFSRRYIPAVYFQNAGGDGKNIPRFPMFLGEWLTGYHEFHIHCGDDQTQSIRIWDPAKRNALASKQKRRLYSRVAEILTYYYNLETFEQIFPWHHGAGDFVVRVSDNELDLRLITVRGYSSLVETNGIDLITILNALLRFFLHLSLRTRIDRLDGTGDLVWADDTAVEGTVSGFFDGLAHKGHLVEGQESPATLMGYYLSRLSQADLTETLEDILGAYPPQSPERHLMASRLIDHGQVLSGCIKQYLLNICH